MYFFMSDNFLKKKFIIFKANDSRILRITVLGALYTQNGNH